MPTQHDLRPRDGAWQKVFDDELERAQVARDKGLGELVFREDGWWWRSIPAEPKKAFERTEDGRYVTNYKQCECGEQYLVGAQHERTSLRHKEWLRGDIEVPVPEQPLLAAFDRKAPKPELILGQTRICPRCKARKRKGTEDLDYTIDQWASVANPFPCRRCNGHGIVPNVGPQ